MRGQSSDPSAVIRVTSFSAPPMIPVAGETSLATIQSQPLRNRLAVALANIEEVIELIKTSKNPAEAKERLIETEWQPGTR